VGQFSHPGRRRENNEDWLGSFQPEDPERLARKGSLFVVADGMGGRQSGEMASRRAVDQVIRSYMEDPTGDVQASLGRAIELANAALHAEASSGRSGRRWGTTLVAAVVRYDELWIANVGDSRAYLLRNGRLQQLSEDHSWASSASGAVPSGDWIGRHVITRALGLKPAVEVDLFPPIKLRVGDRILLCSDGLTTPLPDDEIRDFVARYPPQRAVEKMVESANERGGPDNISVMVIEVAGSRAGASWPSPGEWLAALSRPEVWQAYVEDMAASLFGGEQGFRSPLFILVVVVLVLVIVGLGFVLGLLIFG